MAIRSYDQQSDRDILRSFTVSQYGVLRRALMLLGAAVVALAAVPLFTLQVFGYNHAISLIAFFAAFALTFIVPRYGDTPVGYIGVVAIGGLLGLGLVPTLAVYILAGKITVVLNAALSTAVLFIALAAFAIITKRDFTKLANFAMIAILAAFVVGLLNIFLFKSSLVSLAISYVFGLMSCAMILVRLSFVVRGATAITATELALGLLVDVYNLFVSLLNILGNRE